MRSYSNVNEREIDKLLKTNTNASHQQAHREILIETSDDVRLSSGIKYNDVDEKNSALAQFNNDKQ